MKEDKTIGEAVSGAASAAKNVVVSTKDIKLSSIKKLIINVWKLFVLGSGVFGFFGAAYIFNIGYERGSIYDSIATGEFQVLVIIGIIAFIEFRRGLITGFIFKDRS